MFRLDKNRYGDPLFGDSEKSDFAFYILLI